MSKRIVAAFLFLTAIAFSVIAQEAAQGAASQAASAAAPWKYISAALAVGFACIGGGLAVGKLGAAAMGAIAEDSSLSGKALPYLGLAEGICLWGFLVALLILML
jgi:V/A-type H+/Na+-transporting ATPase subunit K